MLSGGFAGALLLAGWLAVAQAGGAEAQAEQVRLRQEMQSLSAEGQWKGVDRQYRALVGLGQRGLTYDDHLLGAQAAQELGNVQGVWLRLQRALDLDFTDEALAWWASLQAEYGEVDLVIRGEGAEGDEAPTLQIADAPFDPAPRATIEAARRALAEQGRYRGPLPLGQYTLGAREFEVVGGPTVRCVIRR